MPVPREFLEEVERATADREVGRLGLLGREAQGFTWELEGFRLAGRSLFQLRAFTAARLVWERVRGLMPNDVEANLLLGTIYQHLGNQAASDQAVGRVLDERSSTASDRAESLALLSSLAVFPPEETKAATAAGRFQRAFVFTGHMVDRPGRKTPRFPQNRALAAAAAIRMALADLTGGEPSSSIGFAGGASGGDLLFHEACAALGIVSRLRLTLPAGPFIAKSVAPANADWEKRFHTVAQRLEDTLEILSPFEELPKWLTGKADYNIWGRTNVWLLEEALASGAPEVHLLALWNGEGGDGPGGTSHLIELARQEGVSTHILDTKAIFGL